MAYGMMGGYGGSMMGGYFAGYGWVFQLLILFLVLLIFWWLLRGSKEYAANTKESPLDLVKKRYATGEITKKEFEQLRKDLEE